MKPFNLEEYLANPSRKIVTKDGRKVRIICTDAKTCYPIIALVESTDSTTEQSLSFTKNGKYFDNRSSMDDLFFAHEKYEGWVNVYKSESDRSLGTSIWQTEEEAKRWVGAADYVTTIKIEWEE